MVRTGVGTQEKRAGTEREGSRNWGERGGKWAMGK